MCGYICFGFEMYILRAVKTRRAAWSDAVSPEYLYGLLLERLIANKVVEVVGGKVGDHAAI